jgi:CheY-like chemotaxis protein
MEIPVIAMTACVEPEELESCMVAGMNGFVAKPVRMPKLEDQLVKWLPNHMVEEVASPPSTPSVSTGAGAVSSSTTTTTTTSSSLQYSNGSGSSYSSTFNASTSSPFAYLGDASSPDGLAEERCNGHH